MNKIENNIQVKADMMYGYKGSSNIKIKMEQSNIYGVDGVRLVSDYGETMFEGRIEEAAQYIIDLKNDEYVW